MQQIQQAVTVTRLAAGRGMMPHKKGVALRKRAETEGGILSQDRSRGESFSEVAHDARNMVTALGLYCDLLEEPGVLATPYAHYGSELRQVAAASRRLVEKLAVLDGYNIHQSAAATLAALGTSDCLAGTEMGAQTADASLTAALPGAVDSIRQRSNQNRRWNLLPPEPVANLAAELMSNRNLLSALAGPSVALTVDVDGGARPVRLSGEELTRVLVNLAKNAAEAMPDGGRIHIGLRERPSAKEAAGHLELTIDDSGPGIPEVALETIFVSGYSTRHDRSRRAGGWPMMHRGLGLAITRSLVEAAGGRIFAANREPRGTRFQIELPVREAS